MDVARVRLAVSTDRRALVALCRAAVGPDDYVPEYLPEMIARREILVALVGDRIGAMTGLSKCADGSLWIGQLRTHPRWRRRGLARMLLDHAYARVVRERRPALRLWTSQRNIAARTLFETNSFRRVVMFSRMVAEPGAGNAAWRRPDAGDARGLIRTWERSVFGRQGKGYLNYRWRFTRLDGPAVRALAERDELLITPRGTVLIWTDDERRTTAHVAVLSGGKAALLHARRAAGARGFSRVLAFLPKIRQSLAIARQAGFRKASWGTRAILYERSGENQL